MKRQFLLGLMLAIAGIGQAADILKVQGVEVAPGESVALSIELDNETTNLMGWQCDIVLPEGLALALKANGKPAAMLSDRFMATEHAISSSLLASGAYRFIATSMDGESIPSTSGTLFTVTLKADASVTLGSTLTGTVTNIEFNTQDNQKLSFPDVAFDIRIIGNEVQKCATPTIAYDKGELVFASTTEDVAFVSEVKVADAKVNEGERLKLTRTYEVCVYAKRDGYENSDVATVTITWRNGRPVMEGFGNVVLEVDESAGDVNSDGTVGIGDIVAITNIMAGKP
ncbi:MAG: hypothetical protein II949_13050 [Prevotella sp.]|nr:hypothetical protein [Prevotella sp.]